MELEEAIKRLSMKAITSSAEAPDYPNCIVMKKDLITILNHLTKREKMIKLMVEYLNFYGVEDDICTAELSKDCNENCKECIKQYFEKKAEESE